MENAWEMIVPYNGKFIDSYTFIPGEKDLALMRAENSGWFIVTEKMKSRLASNDAKWLSFDEVRVGA